MLFSSQTQQRKSVKARLVPRSAFSYQKFESLSAILNASALVISGLLLVASTLVGMATDGKAVGYLALSAAVTLGLALLLFAIFTIPKKIKRRSIFVATTSVWFGISFIGTLPYYLMADMGRFVDMWFESVSGFTTVGFTVLSGDHLASQPLGLLFFRSGTQWLGGIGVVVLAIAVLPFIGGSGLTIMGSEAPGIVSDKFTPRVRETAKRLAIAYGALTLACVLFFWSRNMNLYEAVVQTFSTVSTGGYSSSPISFNQWGDDKILLLGATFFMFAGGCDIALIWRLLQGDFKAIWRSSELRAYTAWIAVIIMIISVSTWWYVDMNFNNVVDAAFTVVSFVTTTGFSTQDYSKWPPIANFLLLLAMFPGGMTGSTAGGMKILRIQIASSFAKSQLRKQQRTHEIVNVRVGEEATLLPNSIIMHVLGFLAFFIGIWIVSSVIMAGAGLGMVEAMATSASSLASVGLSLGNMTSTNFPELPGIVLVTATLEMIIGRLEIIPVLLTVVTFRDWLKLKLNL